MTNLLVFVVVVGEDVGFETRSSSSFKKELQFLEAFFFDLGACLRLFRFLFPFAKNDDERSSSTMFFSEEPSTLFSVHSTSSSSSSSVVPSSRVAFISIHPRKNPSLSSSCALFFVNSLTRWVFIIKMWRRKCKTKLALFPPPAEERRKTKRKLFSRMRSLCKRCLFFFVFCRAKVERTVCLAFLFALQRIALFFL